MDEIASPASESESIPKDFEDRIVEVSPNGRYVKVNMILGKGAFKVVWKAIDREEGMEVAWNACQTTKAEFVEFSQEIDILKKVRHPNIISFHDSWFNENELVFVTEMMTSGTLREYIKKIKPNLKIIKRWSRQILKGLYYLHSHNPPIIHRDLKCDNVFINGAHGEVKIGDMGSAKMRLGKKYTVIGTPEFMAPEMYEEKGYNEKVDVYAFGMCLLEMCTGEYPYAECKNAAQIYKKVSQGIKPECLSQIHDEEILSLINSCLANENERMNVSQILEHSFFCEDPEVILSSSDETKTQLTLQVVFRASDKMSIKFDFNVLGDTAEDVVNEMIEESVLPEKYRGLITFEINRILRELSKTLNSENSKLSNQWKREGNPVDLQSQIIQLENKLKEREIKLKEKESVIEQLKIDYDRVRLELSDMKKGNVTTERKEEKSRSLLGSTASADFPLRRRTSSVNTDSLDFDMISFKDYADSQSINELVVDVATATQRGSEKAQEWLNKLTAQDILTVGDLRGLHEGDWASLNLTVFAARALKNAIGKGKNQKE
ncbi:Protein kinase, catalytic domain-containing protein [Rozella allomycis CSF55]|uniref:Protein kinase, catalytic domain-containing protein n=1 Tax=Rozella allomycis (strain CSF55) TaxID=988480 RepID=A0A075AV50_ROZAC|nr:Protein kinase, catalytic domain-containing protein [Rozella allomycis CSF55]|eukprot:EPZ34040.1 Protein kinase, catalytic domain-containing protein [Rozella allomycis CSF55]